MGCRAVYISVIFGLMIGGGVVGENLKSQLMYGDWECGLYGSIVFNSTVNSASLTANKKQEILFRVQERKGSSLIGFIRDFNDVKNNAVSLIDGFADLVIMFVNRNDVKIRKQTYPAQGPMYEFAFTLEDKKTFDITVIIYKCPPEDDLLIERKFAFRK